MKSFQKSLWLILLFSQLSSCAMLRLADLRNETANQSEQSARARQLLTEMGQAHQIASWQELATYQVLLEDQFYGFVGKQSSPYGTDSVALELNYIPNTFDGRLAILSGKKEGKMWGLQSWQSYEQKSGAAPVFTKNKDAQFWVPTYQYFIEFPLRIQKATALNYAGEAMIEGIACEGVLASWDTTAPQKEIDQYLVWISQSDRRIVKIEYTIRDQFKFLTGAVGYKDYQTFSGIPLPTRMPVTSNIRKKGLLHEMRIQEFLPNQVTVEELRPDDDLPVMGDEKSNL